MSEVTIRPTQKQDAERIALMGNNKKIWDNLRDYIPYPYSLKDGQDFVKMLSDSDPVTTFAVCYHEELVGIMGFNMQTDIYRESAEIGYWLGEDYWGKGIASKAILLVIDYAFNVLDLKRLYTAVFDYNEASRRVLEKAGFRYEGRAIKSIIKNGEYHDEIKFGLLNPKYFSEHK